MGATVDDDVDTGPEEVGTDDGTEEDVARDIPVTADPIPSLRSARPRRARNPSPGGAHGRANVPAPGAGSLLRARHRRREMYDDIKAAGADESEPATAGGTSQRPPPRTTLPLSPTSDPVKAVTEKSSASTDCHVRRCGTCCRRTGGASQAAQRDRDARVRRAGHVDEDHRRPTLGARQQRGHGEQFQAPDRLRRRVLRGRGLRIPDRRRAAGRADLLPARILARAGFYNATAASWRSGPTASWWPRRFVEPVRV